MKHVVKSIFAFKDKILSRKYSRLMRLDKPVGFNLALLPALWTLCFATNDLWTIFKFSILFFIGAVAARSAGCIINDIYDKDYDAQVERTKNRPLASGEVTVSEAIKVLIANALIALLVLVFLPISAIKSGVIIGLMILIYPLLKRYTFYPQVFLGFVFNGGVWIAWFSISDNVTLVPILTYLGAVAWTIGYDTIYGLQDITDDKKIGVKSLSQLTAEKTPDFAWKMYMITGFCLAFSGFLSNLHYIFIIAMGLATYLFYWQTKTLDVSNPLDAGYKFRSNVRIGSIILIGALLGRLI